MRTPSRLALVSAFLIASTAGAQSARPPVAPGPVNLSQFQQLAHSVYKELVEINTVDSVGSTTRAAEAMAARFRAAGFPAADVQVLVPQGAPTKGNLVVRYRGRGGAGAPRPLLLLAHLDVVAANRADWPRDPFILHEENGYFLGRGTSDDKAMASMFVASLLQLKREGTVPDRDLILALTADEEGGAQNGVEFLIAQHRPLIDAAYAINEGGGGTLEENRPLFHSVQAAEKVPANFTLTATNPGGHSSVPRPDNAIYALATALTRLASFSFPVALNEVTRPFFANTALVEPRAPMAAAMKQLVADPKNAAAAATLSADPRYASMLRTSCVATRLSGGHAYNALPQTATANVNCRIVPTSTLEEVRATIARVIGDTGIHISMTVPSRERFGATPRAVEPELLSATTQLTGRMWGSIPVIPTMSTGATDGRFLRAAGIPTYGVSGIFSEPGETNAHGRDEKLRVKSYYDGLAFLDALVRQLAVKPKA
ncbi:MAG: peptidase [Gemmatimonadetes bacterium]|jgi:acetylornithine deacetylase/succinyl-diaminopimelate desuccinylase-like protein|nr:peptidase [Gemmatimonadota bacterium]